MLELLDEIQTRLGIALLFITHDLRVAAQICDDVAVMQNGRIVEQGPAAQVLAHPQMPYTRQLLDAAPGRELGFCEFRPIAAAAVATSKSPSSSRANGWARMRRPMTSSAIAVGTLIAERPPHRTVRAAFPHTAPTSGG